jgi:hypothetical protein
MDLVASGQSLAFTVTTSLWRLWPSYILRRQQFRPVSLDGIVVFLLLLMWRTRMKQIKFLHFIFILLLVFILWWEIQTVPSRCHWVYVPDVSHGNEICIYAMCVQYYVILSIWRILLAIIVVLICLEVIVLPAYFSLQHDSILCYFTNCLS